MYRFSGLSPGRLRAALKLPFQRLNDGSSHKPPRPRLSSYSDLSEVEGKEPASLLRTLPLRHSSGPSPEQTVLPTSSPTLRKLHLLLHIALGSGLRSAGPRCFLQAARKPNSVLDDHSSRRRIAGPLEQPTRRFRLPLGLRRLDLFAWAYRASAPPSREESRRNPCLFGLAPCGVYHADRLTPVAVRSYRTLSPLPFNNLRG